MGGWSLAWLAFRWNLCLSSAEEENAFFRALPELPPSPPNQDLKVSSGLKILIQPKNQPKFRIIGILEEIDSFN